MPHNNVDKRKSRLAASNIWRLAKIQRKPQLHNASNETENGCANSANQPR